MATCPSNRLGASPNPDKPIKEYDIQKIEKMYKCTVSRTAYDQWFKEKMDKACAVDSCITTQEIKSTKRCRECVFPFTYENITHTACTPYEDAHWCSTKTDENGVHLSGHWGYCNMDKCTYELIPGEHSKPLFNRLSYSN